MKIKYLFLILTMVVLTNSYAQQVGKTIDEEIVEMEEVEMEDEPADEVSFTVIDEVPVFPGCEGSQMEKRKCFNTAMQRHIRENFTFSIADKLKLSYGTKRVYITFKISASGAIEKILTRGPHKALEDEAKRVIKLLPKMVPGKQRGRAISVRYTLPILFKVDGKPRIKPSKNSEINSSKTKTIKTEKTKKKVVNY